MRTPDPFPPAPAFPLTPGGPEPGSAAAHHALGKHDGTAPALGRRDPDELLTPEHLAALLMVDRETVYRMARRGELPAIKIARQWRFRAGRISRWLADLESKSEADRNAA